MNREVYVYLDPRYRLQFAAALLTVLGGTAIVLLSDDPGSANYRLLGGVLLLLGAIASVGVGILGIKTRPVDGVAGSEADELAFRQVQAAAADDGARNATRIAVFGAFIGFALAPIPFLLGITWMAWFLPLGLAIVAGLAAVAFPRWASAVGSRKTDTPSR